MYGFSLWSFDIEEQNWDESKVRDFVIGKKLE